MVWQYSDGELLTGASNASVVGENHDSRRISGYRIYAIKNCDGRPCSLPHRWPRVSESCLSQPPRTTYEEKRTEQDLIVGSGKSEAEVTNNRRLRSTYCYIEANCWQTRSIARPLCDSRAIWKTIAATVLHVILLTNNYGFKCMRLKAIPRAETS